MTIKTRTITEGTDGSLNCRHFAEVEVDDQVDFRREGNTASLAARAVVSALRYWADDAERKFVESGVIPGPPPASATVERQDLRTLVERVQLQLLKPPVSVVVQEALNMLTLIADGRVKVV